MQNKLVALIEEWGRALLRTRQAATNASSLQKSEISIKDIRFSFREQLAQFKLVTSHHSSVRTRKKEATVSESVNGRAKRGRWR